MDYASSSIRLTFSSTSSSRTIKTHLSKISRQAFLPLTAPKYYRLKSYSFQIPCLRAPTSTSQSCSIQSPLANFSTSQAKSPNPKQKQSHALKSHVEKLAVLLLGSFLFLGRFTAKAVFALPANSTAGFPAASEEKVEIQNGEDDEDEELCLKLLEKNPTDVKALKMMLFRRMKKGKTKEAVQYVERLIEVEPDELEWRLLQALSYELLGQLSKAKRLFREILLERPLQIRALHGLALAMHKNHEGPAVFEMLNEALELAHAEKRVIEERNIKILIAQMYIVEGDLEEGLRRLQGLVDEDPRDFRPYLCQGIIYSLLEKKEEANEQFEMYRSLVPNEFPQRGFLDDLIISAKTESQGRREKQFSYKR